jgi:hypothetical protein
LGAAGQATGGGEYQIERSVRFNSPDSAYLSRTPASSGNRKTWTWAGWVKRSELGNQTIFEASPGGDFYTLLWFTSSDQIQIVGDEGASPATIGETSAAVFRDVSAWMHVLLAVDTSQASASSRVRLYINGIEATLTKSLSPSLNYDTYVNSANAHAIAGGARAGMPYFSGSLADIHFIDSQALTPSAFGEFDTNGVWQPIEYTGTYGTNGFHLPFSDNSTAAALGTDTSSNGNDWTPNNLSVNNGNGNYLSAGSYSFTGSQIGPLRNAYDGISGTSGGSTSGVTFWGIAAGTATHSGLSKSFTSGVRVFYNVNVAGGSISVNGSSKSAPVPPGGNTTIGVLDWTGIISSPFTSISITSPNGGVGVYVSGIEIDGVLLIDSTVAAVNNDSLVDSPTNGSQTDTGVGGEVVGNYCTWNPLDKSVNTTLANGNLDCTWAAASGGMKGTIGISSGKWYWEITVGANASVGLIKSSVGQANSWPGDSVYGSGGSYGYAPNGQKVTNSSYSAYGTAHTNGDVVGVAYDADNGKLFFSRNGTWQASGDPAAGTNAAFTSITGEFSSGLGYWTTPTTNVNSVNFGQRPFAYTAPSGFKALCTTNLPEPTIADGSTAMDVVTYTGNGSTQTISGLNFSPDLVWIKSRSQNSSHCLLDTVRGRAGTLNSDNIAAEYTASPADRDLVSFDSTGFTLGQNYNNVTNTSPSTYVAWTWDAGSSTVSNTEGSITSQVRANPSAGFSIVTATCASGTNSYGHGLGVKPSMYIVKNRDVSQNWQIWHQALSNETTAYLQFNTSAQQQYSTMWAPSTSTTISLVSDGPIVSGDDFVAYCFAPVAGYSSFGSYTGNGSADGPFVYTGFRPRWVMWKNASYLGSWYIHDTSRSASNVTENGLFPNIPDAENSTYTDLDILSNGFKQRTAASNSNASGNTYIYAAFAEHPFQSSRAR